VSLFELPGASTSISLNGGPKQTLNSPWKTATADLATNLPLITEKLSLTDQPYIEGRININFAQREILVALPGMNDTLADQIVGAQEKSTAGASGAQLPADKLNAGWLVINGILTINQLEKIDPFVTGRGDVFHVQSVGYFEGGGPMARVEAIVDASQDPPQVIFMRDLTELGRGFSAALLTTGSGPTR